MAIRLARLEDIPALVEIGHAYHSESRFKAYDYDSAKLAANLEGLIKDTTGARCFFVADDKEQKPYGLLMGCIESYFFSNCLVAQSILFWVHPDYRGGSAALKLVTTFKKWAENRSVFEIAIGVNSAVHIDRADKFFKKLGFQLTGGNYSMMLGGQK
ncbi:MAG: GNAT family N-acetyltransferase [Sulfuricella sp.]